MPNASKTEVYGLYGDALRIRLKAPPVDGKANKAVCEFVADKLEVPIKNVVLKSGITGRGKKLLIYGQTPERVSLLLQPTTI